MPLSPCYPGNPILDVFELTLIRFATSARCERPSTAEARRTMKEHSSFNRLMRVGVLATLLVVEACAAGPQGENTEDRAITARVQALLGQYDSLQAPNSVTAQTVQHVVYLRGLVSTPYQKRLAGSIAAQAAGGLHIVNMVAVENNR
jgi:osmotically-inducible protein OsmY